MKKDFELIKEMNMVIDNEYSDYQKENALTKNYAKKWKKGKFNFKMAHKGVLNNVVTPRVRKYQNQYRTKVGNTERNEIAKARLRNIMRRIKEGNF